jgi:VWFA-related protein
MRRARTLVLLAGLAITPAVSTQEQTPTFRAAADAVSVDVSVRRAGRPVTGLDVRDFTVTDNGVRQTISAISYERNPIDVTVILDVSQSVSGAVLDQLRRALEQLRGDLAKADRLKIVTVNMRVRRLMDFSDPASGGPSAFATVRAFGTTAIYDALAVALAGRTAEDRRQLVVLFSDGVETGSVTDAATLLDVARRTTPTVTTVLASRPAVSGMGGAIVFPTGAFGLFAGFYRELTQTTGGAMVALMPNDSVAGTLRRVVGEFRASYVLHFTPTGVTREGVHALDVQVGRSGVDVRARREYVWR